MLRMATLLVLVNTQVTVHDHKVIVIELARLRNDDVYGCALVGWSREITLNATPRSILMQRTVRVGLLSDYNHISCFSGI